MLLATFTAWESHRFGGELANLQRRAFQELHRGQSLQSEQQRYQQALNIVAANGTKNIQLKPAQANAGGNLPPIAVYWNPQMGLTLSADKIPQVPPSRTLQLWIIPQTGPAISAGAFRPNATGQILLVASPSPAINAAKSLIITDEPTPESPQPTTPPKWSAQLP